MNETGSGKSIIATGKKWALILSGIAAVAGATIPPWASYLSGTRNVSAHNNSMAAGENINNTINNYTNYFNNYFNSWMHGFDIITGSQHDTSMNINNKTKQQALVSHTAEALKFIDGPYIDLIGTKCQVTASILTDGRQDIAFTCKDDGGQTISGDVITGSISGHPYELDLLAAKIDQIPGYNNFAWGKVAYTGPYRKDVWNCMNTSDIVSGRQVGNIFQLSCYDNGNIQACGISLTKQQ